MPPCRPNQSPTIRVLCVSVKVASDACSQSDQKPLHVARLILSLCSSRIISTLIDLSIQKIRIFTSQPDRGALTAVQARHTESDNSYRSARTSKTAVTCKG